jgi:hypothetical protein
METDMENIKSSSDEKIWIGLKTRRKISNQLKAEKMNKGGEEKKHKRHIHNDV